MAKTFLGKKGFNILSRSNCIQIEQLMINQNYANSLLSNFILFLINKTNTEVCAFIHTYVQFNPHTNTLPKHIWAHIITYTNITLEWMKQTIRNHLNFYSSLLERQWGQVVVEKVEAGRADTPLPEPLSNDEGKLEWLGRIEARVAVRVVARAQVVEGDSPWPADALRHILTGHLQVHASRVAPFLLVNIEERPHLRLSKSKNPHNKLPSVKHKLNYDGCFTRK